MNSIATSVSSSSTQVVQATPAPSALKGLLDEVLGEVADLHEIDDTDGLRDLATIYFESADKEGFIFNFDEVWPHAGYARKDKAKRANVGDKSQGATAGGLRRGIDVQISVKPSPPIKSGHGGDRKTEQILLTHRGFSHFCLSARTPQGMMVRDFVISLVKGVRKLQKALDAGEVALVRGPGAKTEYFPQANLEDAAVVRLESCELTKMLGQKLCKPGNKFDSSFGVVHGTINKMAMGIIKAELAELIQKNLSQFSARDYMTHEQQILARGAMFEACKEPTREAAIARVHTICQNSRGELMLAMHCQPGTVPEKFMTLKRARKTVALIEDASPSPIRLCRRELRN